MKPVLREVTDKNGNVEMVFSPTALMVLYSINRAKNPGLSSAEVCRMTKIDPGLPGKWAAKYGTHFTNWLEEALDAQTDDDAAVLERVGMIQAVQSGNFQFWREMARAKGVIKDEQPKKGLTINTDFTVIMQESGGNLELARQKMLAAVRGHAQPVSEQKIIEAEVVPVKK